MDRQRLWVSILCAFLLSLLIKIPAYAQIGNGESMSSGMAPRVHGHGFCGYSFKKAGKSGL